MYFTYVLYSSSIGKYYIGQTKNLEKRLLRHNEGDGGWTKRGIPWKLVYSESFPSRREAMKREIYLKSGRGRMFLKNKAC